MLVLLLADDASYCGTFAGLEPPLFELKARDEPIAGDDLPSDSSSKVVSGAPEGALERSDSFLALGRGLRVLHVAETWTGGVGIYLTALILQQIADPRVERITLACSAARTPAPLAFEPHPKVEIVRYVSSRAPWGVVAASRRIKSIAQRVQPDLVHLHSTFAGVYGRLFEVGFPVVYCAHGWAFTQDVSRASKLAYASIEAWLAHRTAALVHISHDEQRAALRYGVHAPIDRVVLHGTRPPRYGTTAPLQVDPNRVNLGFIGRFDRQKGLDLLLDVFAAVPRKDLHLYLIGAFDRESASKGQTLPPQERVTVVGWVPEQDIDTYISSFDALVIPSRWEGFGFVAAEAMRNGKPVIVSHRGGLPEQVVHGFNGLVFSLETPAALVDILNTLDKQKLARLGENARSVWSHAFSEERAYQELMDDVYASTLARTKKAGPARV